MRKNTSFVCYLAITLLLSLSPFAFGEKNESGEFDAWQKENSLAETQDANKPTTQLNLTGVKPFDEIEPASLEEIKELAFQGNAFSQYILGSMYYEGRGVPQDYKQAEKWFIRAAEQGNPEIQYNLGKMYNEKGMGKSGGMPRRDYEQAVKWYTKAAEQEYADAQYSLGYMYVFGNAVPKNGKQVIKWWTKAAEQGHAKAQVILGLSYNNGDYVRRNYKEAVKWYTRAAEQGDATAQHFLGLAYYNGTGIPRDYKEGLKWVTKAAEQGNFESQVFLSEIYDKGYGVPRDYKQAEKWLSKVTKTKESQRYAESLLNLYFAPPEKTTISIWKITTIILIGIAICLMLFLIYKYVLKNIPKMISWLWKARRLTVFWAGTFVIISMCLFPPWVRDGKIVSHAHFLFSSGVGSYRSCIYGAHIDLVRLAIQFIIVALITGALFYTLNSKTDEQKQ